MRGRTLALAALLLTTGLAGCVGTSTQDPDAASSPGADGLDPADVDAPEDAKLADVETGVQLVFEDVTLPFEQEIPVPEGTTVVDVRATAESDDTALYPALRDADTGAMRCTTRGVDGWQGLPTGTASCAGVTILDPLETTWTASVAASGNATAETVTIHLYDEPLDGPVSRLDAANLSKPHHEVGERTTHAVESHDGTELFVEVHEPAGGHEAYPTVLVSTPYNTLTRVVGAQPYEAFIEDLVKRGYAVALADVRGFGQSDGCVDVWGPDEQGDQAVLVDWVTDQDFSNGKVGMFGASYPGTTPVEAAVQAPDGLEAIVPVASVVNAYQDWHYGGVPTGENLGSPVAYQAIGTATTPRPADPVDTARDLGNGLCDPTLAGRANDPRAIHDEFYEVRNFSQRADEIEAAVLQQHGFVDATVKPSLMHSFFERVDEPKLALLGHWAHNYAVRADQATLRLAWMDQFVKGNDVGLGNVSETSVEANEGYRSASDWPPADNEPTTLHPDFEAGRLSANATDGSATLLLEPTGASGVVDLGPAGASDRIALGADVESGFGIAGKPHLVLDASLEGAANGYVGAELYEVTDDDRRLITYGAANLAHRGDHASYEPFAPGERASVPLPLQPTDYRVEDGSQLELVIEASEATGLTRGSNPGQLVLHGGEDGTALRLPSLPADAYEEVPLTVDPSPGS